MEHGHQMNLQMQHPNSSTDGGEKPALDSEKDKPVMPDDSEAGEKPEGGMNAGGDNSMMESVKYHMASFDYAYRCISVMEWLFEN